MHLLKRGLRVSLDLDREVARTSSSVSVGEVAVADLPNAEVPSDTERLRGSGLLLSTGGATAEDGPWLNEKNTPFFLPLLEVGVALLLEGVVAGEWAEGEGSLLK